MAKVAVIATGGKQYLVKSGDVLEIEKVLGKDGENIEFDVLLLADDKGTGLEVGKPKLSTKVKGKVLKQFRTTKIDVIKFKAKIRYRRKHGHRQHQTKVQIENV